MAACWTAGDEDAKDITIRITVRCAVHRGWLLAVCVSAAAGRRPQAAPPHDDPSRVTRTRCS